MGGGCPQSLNPDGRTNLGKTTHEIFVACCTTASRRGPWQPLSLGSVWVSLGLHAIVQHDDGKGLGCKCRLPNPRVTPPRRRSLRLSWTAHVSIWSAQPTDEASGGKSTRRPEKDGHANNRGAASCGLCVCVISYSRPLIGAVCVPHLRNCWAGLDAAGLLGQRVLNAASLLGLVLTKCLDTSAFPRRPSPNLGGWEGPRDAMVKR